MQEKIRQTSAKRHKRMRALQAEGHAKLLREAQALEEA